MSETYTNNELKALVQVANNALLARQRLFDRLTDPRRDMDKECGYPADITLDQYQDRFDRGDIARRIVTLFPDECWKQTPELYENEDESVETEFEKAWNELVKEWGLWGKLHTIDVLSGICQYGVILWGIDDGKQLHEPAEGFNPDGTWSKDAPKRKLIYIRTLPQKMAQCSAYETDPTNPRFGKPTVYDLQLIDPSAVGVGMLASQQSTAHKVHWTRVTHIADNCLTSDIFGEPRMRVVFNRLLDLVKLAGGSAEMFWRGAFPGYSFEVNPDVADEVELNPEEVRKEMENFSNKLQRYIALQGVTAKSLAPQVADPNGHIEAQLLLIAIAMNVPLRILKGSEEAKLASTQDKGSWNERVGRRCNGYVSDDMIKRVAIHLMGLGIVPRVEPKLLCCDWPALDAMTDAEKADIAVKKTNAISTYVTSGMQTLVPPLEYLTGIMDMTAEEAEAWIEAANDQEAEFAAEGLNPDGTPVMDMTMVDELGNPIEDPEMDLGPDPAKEPPVAGAKKPKTAPGKAPAPKS